MRPRETSMIDQAKLRDQVIEKIDDMSELDRLELFLKLVKDGHFPNFAPLLPLVLTLDGKPYSLENHFQFETLFYTRMPKAMVLKTGRQVGKSTVGSAHGVITCTSIPYFRTLYVTPLFEQVRRLSNNYVRPFVEQSPIRNLWIGNSTENSVLQRSFRNYSMMQFSFASLDADRVRGVRADKIVIDEVQDIDQDHIPIIKETMSASPWALSQFSGTPKTPENTIEGLWLMSSQAEWCIPCRNCKKLNVSATTHDLEKMIGPYRDDISEANPGTVCAKCQKVIHPNDGRWIHKYPERRFRFAGFHVPQPIMHIHYSEPSKWTELIAKREGYGNYTPEKYMNEVLGESCGVGVQLVSMDELQKACVLNHENKPKQPEDCMQDLAKYRYRILSVDWGGGGEEGISLTVATVMGITPTGVVHVIWARRLMTPHDHLAEARQCLHYFNLFKCHFVSHDFTGAGVLRETLLCQAGVEYKRLIPIRYIRASAAKIMTHIKPTSINPRSFYQVDKTRSLLTTCAAIRLMRIRFFKYDYKSTDDPGLIHDFLALTERKTETRLGSDVYTIGRNPHLSDDFAQAVNIGCCALWHMTGAWPNFNVPEKFQLSEEVENHLQNGSWSPVESEDGPG
jgi:hypothetical protein